jgi:hypothetical protein
LPTTPLQFAVIDGHDPSTWRPWGNDQPSLGELAAELDRRERPAELDYVFQLYDPKFIPLLRPVDQLLEDGQVLNIVGAIFDPDDKDGGPSMQDKLKLLAKLCIKIKHESDQTREPPLAFETGFEIWFIDRGHSKADRWGWAAAAQPHVTGALGGVEIRADAMRSPEAFERLAELVEMNSVFQRQRRRL